ncbi:MAG: hypothetical protein ACI85U_001688 [Candidatus Promineifilaceae bacterium]|jgi:hypothetical protein
MSLIKENDKLTDKDGNLFTVEKYLGEGVTAEVFKAERQDGLVVALKVLRPNLPKEIVQSFRDEAHLLSQLEQYSRNQYPGQPVYTPELLGRSENGATPEFLALEFLGGQPLDKMIVATGGLVNELDGELHALIMGEQVLQVLDILHRDIRCSYIDFQLKNILWFEEQQVVKVMDWNHVSERAPDGQLPEKAPDDLVRFGAYLYQLMTGKGASQTGERKGELAKRAGGRWEKMSLGLQEIIGKALHINPNKRYQDAGTFLADIVELRQLWVEDLDELYDLTARNIRRAQRWKIEETGSADGLNEALFEASRSIDLYIRRADSGGEELIGRLQTELQTIQDNISPKWGTGRQYYEAGIYSQAVSNWEEEARNLSRLDLWRWVILARIASLLGGENYSKIKPLLEESIAKLDNGDGDSAAALLSQAAHYGSKAEPYQLLVNEADVWSHLNIAKLAQNEKNWVEATQAYELAERSLAKINDATHLELLTPETGSRQQILDKANECRGQQETSEGQDESIKRLKQLLDQGKVSEAVKALSVELKKEPNQPLLLQAVLKECEQLSPQDAYQLLTVSALYGPSVGAIDRALHARQTGLEQQQQLKLQQEYKHKLESERQAKQEVEEEQLSLKQEDEKKQTDRKLKQLGDALDENDWQKAQAYLSQLGKQTPQDSIRILEKKFKQALDQKDWVRTLAWGNTLKSALPTQKREAVSTKIEEARAWHDKELEAAKSKMLGEIDVETFIARLDAAGLKVMGRDINMKLKDIQEKAEKKNSPQRNSNPKVERSDTKLFRSVVGTLLGFSTLLLVALIGLGYLFSQTQSNQAMLEKAATDIAEISTEMASQSDLVPIASDIDDLGAEIAHLKIIPEVAEVEVEVAEVEVEVAEAEVTPTPIPLKDIEITIEEELPALIQFDVFDTDTAGNPTGDAIPVLDIITGLGVGETNYNITTTFGVPSYTLSIPDGWQFKVEDQNIVLTHPNTDESSPLIIERVKTSEEEENDKQNLTSEWIIIPESFDGPNAKITIGGEKLADLFSESGEYSIRLVVGESSLGDSQAFKYTVPPTITLNDDLKLRTRPTANIPNEVSYSTGPDVSLGEELEVLGYVCDSDTAKQWGVFMYFAIRVDDLGEVYWVKNGYIDQYKAAINNEGQFNTLEETFGPNVLACLEQHSAKPTPVPTAIPTLDPTAIPGDE